MAKKYEIVYNYIRVFIDENKFTEKDKIPSEHFLCNKFNVSRQTVRAAFVKLENEGWIFPKRGSGTYFNKTFAIENIEKKKIGHKKIGLIIQGQDRSANASLISGVNSVINSDTVDLKIMLTDNKFANERKCLASITKDFDGLIIDGVKASIMNPNMDYYQKLYEKNIRIIFYNNFYRDMKFPKIIHNEILCAEKLIGLLVKKAHKRIAGIFVFDNYQGIEKYNGYVSALLKYRLVFDDRYVKWCVSEEMTDKKLFAKSLLKFLKNIRDCTAIVCSNFIILNALVEILDSQNLKIPDDISVVCFDYSCDDYRERGIASSVHPGYDIGVEAAIRVLEMIEDDDYKAHDYSYIFEPHVYEGTSIRQL